MTTRLSFIEIRQTGFSLSGKTRIFEVYTLEDDDERLGFIEWLGRWRKYVFRPITSSTTWFEQTCLREIADFIENETKLHRNAISTGGG